MFRARWDRTLAALGVPAERGAAAFNELLEAYGGAGRYYHNLDHLEDVLATLDTLAEHAQNRPALELAAWFHDAVYDSRADDNEERSALLAETVCAGWGLPAETTDLVGRLIRATRTHQAAADDRDAAVLLDADLAVLGAEREVYDGYAAAIRREYAWVAENDYKRGRSRILREFLRRKRIYRLETMHDNRDSRARENLTRELKMLTGE